MREPTIARNYAEALFDLAIREDRTEEYGVALEQVARLLDEEPSIRLFLETPRVPLDEKKAVLRKGLEGKLPNHVLNFLLLVLDKRRQRIVRAMSREYQLLLDDRLGRTHVEVTVARVLGESEVDELKAQLTRILGKEALPSVRVRPELLGGIVFRSGDTIFDGSVRRRLEGMRRELLRADVSAD